MKKLSLSSETGVQLPARNLITIIGACLVGAWFGFGVIERINVLETQNKLNSKDIEMNTEFRIKWPLGELGSLPADSEQFLLIEDLVKDVEKIQEQMESMMHNKVNIQRLQKDVGNIIEHTYKDKMSDCLKSKRLAEREVRPDRVQFSCKKVKAETEIYMGQKKILKILK